MLFLAENYSKVNINNKPLMFAYFKEWRLKSFVKHYEHV